MRTVMLMTVGAALMSSAAVGQQIVKSPVPKGDPARPHILVLLSESGQSMQEFTTLAACEAAATLIVPDAYIAGVPVTKSYCIPK